MKNQSNRTCKKSSQVQKPKKQSKPKKSGRKYQEVTKNGQKTKKVIKAWGGFSDGRLHSYLEHYTDHRTYAVYTTEKAAKHCYEDYRPIEINYTI